ncbi:FeoA domain-containing protein [Propionibacteriaceae bacterium G1746]
MSAEPGSPCQHCTDLQACRAGTDGVVTCVLRDAHNAAAVRRLAELGLRPGASVVAGRQTPGGGRVVGVADAWLALDAATLRIVHLAPAHA